jgi:iron complex outermembrane receptor protein
VLRGPQGTVFGRNATGGLINVITPEPKFDTSGNISAKYGRLRNSTGDVDVRGYITGGLTDNLAADLSAVYRNTGDYIKNLAGR